MADTEPKPVAGPSDDTTVREFANLTKGLLTAVLSKDFIGAFKKGSEILAIAGDLFGMFHADQHPERDVTNEELAALQQECESCKTSLQGVGAPEDTKAINPETVLLIIDFALKIIEAIRKRRNPTT